jgi:ActR/RegA family two-component response regulator
MDSSKLRALVVDDNPVWLRMLVRLVNEVNYEVTTASSCEEAWQKIEKDMPDLVVADLRLKDEDESNTEGLLLIGKLKEDRELESAVLVTGYPTPEAKNMADRLGIAYFEKSSFSRSDFLQEIGRDTAESSASAKSEHSRMNLAKGWKRVARAFRRSHQVSLEPQYFC